MVVVLYGIIHHTLLTMIFFLIFRLLTAKNIARPQANFKVAVDNSSLTPFVPKIKDKPNSLKPLAILPEYDENGIVVR